MRDVAEPSADRTPQRRIHRSISGAGQVTAILSAACEQRFQADDRSHDRRAAVLETGLRTATYKLATLMALVDDSVEYLPENPEDELAVPIRRLAGTLAQQPLHRLQRVMGIPAGPTFL